MAADELVRHFGMRSHPEGGFFVETYRSQGRIPAGALPEGWGEYAWSTAILFLLRQGDCSRLHRIRQDETWHFYLGGLLSLAAIASGGAASETVSGQDVAAGQKVQCTVPAGSWFGARPCEGTDYALVGCTAAPGFEFADYELGTRGELLSCFPRHRSLVEAFTAP